MITAYATFSNGESEKAKRRLKVESEDQREFITQFVAQCFNYAEAHDMSVAIMVFTVENQE